MLHPPSSPESPAATPCALGQTQQAILLRQDLLGSAIYTIGLTVHIDGAVDPALLERATQDVIAAEPMLRAHVVDTADGPCWQIAPTVSWRLPVIDDRAPTDPAAGPAQDGAARALADLQQHGIDPRGDNLWRFALYRTSSARWAWLLGFNHLLVDGHGVLLVVEGIVRRYNALLHNPSEPALPPGPDYGRFVAREQAYLLSARHARDRAFWDSRLAQGEAVTQSATPGLDTLPEPAKLRWTPDADAWRQYQEQAASHGLTPAQAVLFFLGSYIALVTGQPSVRLGMPLHNRKDAIDKRTVGVFANTLPVLLGADAATPVFQAMRTLADDIRQVLRHQQFPLDDVLARLAPRHGVVGMHFDVMVSVEDFGHHTTLGDAHLVFAPFSGHPGFAPIAAYVRHYAEVQTAPIDFVLDPRAPAALRHTAFLRERLDHLLLQLAENTQQTFAELSLLSSDERAALHALQATDQPRPGPQCLHLAVAEQARRTPQADAVRFGDQRLSYDALERAANRLAHRLRALGVGRDVCVPVRMDRRPQLVVALLGVLKAGGAYVPLDADLPLERVRGIVQQSGARVMLAASAQHATLAAALANPVLQWLDADLDADGPDTPPAVDPSPDDVAVVIFTSGSTGQPKGVMLTHRGLCNHKLWNLRAVNFGPQDRLLQKSSLSFDASISEFFLPLLCGAAVHLAPPGLQRDLHGLLQHVIAERITHLTLAPSTARALIDEPALRNCTSLRVVQFGGEPLDAALAARVQAALPQARILNFYGPSESTEDSALYAVDGAIDPHSGMLPVGRPIDNTRIHVLDPQQRLLPFDVVGEVCIAGLGVARGYLGQPELTAARFVADPFQTDSRMVRSGDLGYWAQDGQLHIVGRSDDQIKLRGFRIEIGEVETALRQHPAVAQAAVTVWAPPGGESQLAAYLVLRPEHAQTALGAVRLSLQARLPHYMVPAAWQTLPALPLTASGKLDRASLPAPQPLAADVTAPTTPPRSATERTLWAIWSEVLHLDAFGVHDHFFDLGGHSLTLTQVRSRIQTRFGLTLPLSALFTHLTLEALAQHIDAQQRDAQQQHPITVIDRNGVLPVSLSQRRMWVIQHFHPETLAYNVTVPLRLHGQFDPAVFERALALLVQRHEGLRTQFALRGQEPVQIILPSLRMTPEIVDLRALPPEAREQAARQTATAFMARPFDLAQAPLHRLCLMRLSDTDHVLFWVLHHTIADNWALSVLARDALQLYAALLDDAEAPPAKLPPLTIGYADYAAWQRSSAVAAAREAQLDYWVRHLQGLTDLPLPTDFARPAAPSFLGSTVHGPLSPALLQRLRTHCAAHDVTPFMLLLASFNVLLARITRSDDIAVGTPIANRHHPATEQLVGTLVNTLVMRNTVDLNTGFDALVQQVRATALQAYAHQDAPFDELIERLDTQRANHPQGLVRVLFNVLNAPLGAPVAVPFTYAPFDFDRVAAQFDLSLHIDTEFSHRIVLEYATDLFSADSAQRLLDSYVQLTEQLLAQPQAPLWTAALLTPPQRALLSQWNATAAPVSAAPNLLAFLQLDAAERRERIAITDATGRSLRYGALHARALQIAALLQSQGVTRGDRVGLCLQRHADMLAALLGVLHTGAAYVPLDPGFPPQRLHAMAADAGLRCILSHTDLLPLLAASGVPQLALDTLRRDAPGGSALVPGTAARADDPAYILYTSGSTGQPKGVAVPHGAVINFLQSMARQPGLQPDDTLLAVTTLSFDIAVLELLLPLAVGARVVLADHAQSRDPEALRDLLRSSGATVMQATPSTWRMLLDTGWSAPPPLRAFIGGEALPADLAARLLGACSEVWNLYGPTETTVWSTCWRVQPGQPIVIGRPIANTQVWVLDPHGQPCPIGVPGELHIGGHGVALGYLHRPDLTAERFVPDPFSNRPGARLYKTGDLGRWRHDGQLEHLGRLDHQVKIRGFRFELGEVEAALRAQPGIGACVVTTHTPAADDVRLVAYVVAAPGAAAPNPTALRHALRLRLPDYMTPQHIVPLPALPLLPNGKLDRAALPPPQSVPTSASAASADLALRARLPATAEEQCIAAIWRELLGVDRVLLTDNFFDLGGHSLLAMRAVTAIKQQLGWSIAPRRLIFESLGQLARPAASPQDSA